MGLMGGYRDRHYFPHGHHGPRDRGYYDFRPPVGYFAAVRHPWTSLLILLPLLAVYEFGVRRFGGEGPSLRAGVELWLQQWLAQEGHAPIWAIPATLVGLLLLWAIFRWNDRPTHFVVPTLGILFESVACGIGIYALCLNAPQIVDKSGLHFAAINVQGTQVLTFLGVGLYEEAIFRLIGFALLARLLRILFVPGVIAIPIAILVSAAGFALAHHLVQSDPFVPMVLFMRMIIGACCAILCWLRGLGVAVGAHIIYDLVASTRVEG